MTATDDRQGADLLGGEAGVAYRPDLDPANAGEPGWVYLLHLDPPYRHAAHYTGSAEDLAQRLRQHGTCDGARLLEVQREAGGTWHVARTWPGGPAEEYALKRARMAARICPTCSPGTRRGSLADIRRSVERDQARWLAQRQAAARGDAGPSRDGDQILVSPEARGREDAARFLSIWDGASADEIGAAAAERQEPYYAGERTPEGDAQQGAFADVITAAIEARRSTERARSAAVAQPQEVAEVSTHTTAGVETRPATEWVKGAQTAHDLIVRQVEAGQDAEVIAARWDEALAAYDDATASDAERQWHAGAEETAQDMIQTWREMERAEAEQAQAARDERQAAKDAIDRRAAASRAVGETLAHGEPAGQLLAEYEQAAEAARQYEREEEPEPEGTWHLSEERGTADDGKTCDCDYDACRSGELPSALQEPGQPEPEPEAEPEVEAEAG
jgi:predicted GIY-YIG superfamily endonuclease